jgi:hypothetical protein
MEVPDRAAILRSALVGSLYPAPFRTVRLTTF